MNRDELILKMVRHVATPKIFEMYADKNGEVSFASTGPVTAIGRVSEAKSDVAIKVGRQEFLAKRYELSHLPEGVEIPSEAKYAAQDIQGSWFSFTEKPVLNPDGWTGAGKTNLREGYLVCGINLHETLQKL